MDGGRASLKKEMRRTMMGGGWLGCAVPTGWVLVLQATVVIQRKVVIKFSFFDEGEVVIIRLCILVT